MEKKTNTPHLRFPDFKGDWQKKKLGEVAPLQRGFDLPVDNIKIGKFPVVFSNGILKYHNEFKAKAPGVVTGRSGTIGKVTFVEKDYWPHNTSLWVTDFNGNYPKFIFYFYSKYNLERFGTGSGVPTLNRNNIHVQEEFFPSLDEQTKIANFLSCIDKKIQALKKKKSLLEQYKKGVMQKIFSQELRFKDENGVEFPEWELKKLGEVLIKNSTKNKDQEYSLVQSVSNKHGFINQDEMFEDRRVASKDTSNYYVIKKGHFAYNPSRIDVGSLAYKYDTEISVISPLYISFNANNLFVSDAYLLNWFSSEQFLKQMNSSFEGSVRNTLSYESLIKMLILIPSFYEQIKISNFLSSIEEKINQTQSRIEKTEQWKKGLLQRMFC